MEGGTMVCYGLYLFNSWLDFSQKSSSIVIWKQFLKPNTEMQLQKSSFDFILNSYVNLSSTYLGCTLLLFSNHATFLKFLLSQIWIKK